MSLRSCKTWISVFSGIVLVGALSLTGCEPTKQTPKGPTGKVDPKAATEPEKDPEETPAPKPAAAEEIQILCGSSFRPPMEKLRDMYKAETGNSAVLVFGGSEDHLPKVKQKIAGDVFVSHTPYMQYTRDADAMLREEAVGFLAPVLVVKKGIDKKITKVEDLAQDGLKVVLPNPKYSTCGEMVFALLEKKGIKEDVLKNVGGAQVRSHSEVGNLLKIGTCEAGIMWNGVAHNYLDEIDVVPAPYEYEDEIGVAVMGLSYSKKKEAAEKFLDFVKEHGKKVFAEYGYVKEVSGE